jgi:erythromycin esterase-like protein
MLAGFKTGIALGGAMLLTSFARAQAPTPLPTHAVRSISPTDTDFRDLEFLKAEIGPARVVMLGEPSHGEGNVFEAKIRLVRYLHEQLGFTTVAFESGFYDLHKAQQALEAGRPAQEALGNSVFPIWMNTQPFQAMLPLVGKGGLRVAGFDPQLMTTGYSGDLTDDLEEFLTPDKAAALLNFDYLDQVTSFMGENGAFVPTTTLTEFEKEMGKVARLVDKAAASPEPRRRAEAAFWQQNLRSLLGQARKYATNQLELKNDSTFKAVDSNPRDAQMADNLLWYLRQHPQEKVICWAALPHLANRTDSFDQAEMQPYRPMGRAVKDALGPDQVYILGTLGGGGQHGVWFEAAKPKAVPAPAAGSLEAELLAQPADYAFVSLKHDAAGRRLTTYAFDYQPMSAVWSEAVDGFLFLRQIQPAAPMRAQVGAATAAPADSTAPARARGSVLNPVARPVRVAIGSAAGAAQVRGVVLDRKTGQPVPYASVSMPAQGVGTVADGQGRFGLRARPGTLTVSSVGYAEATITATDAPLTVRLQPAAYELQSVEVRGESLDPRKIMKKVLAARPTNYDQGDYATEVYTYRRVSNFDSLAYEGEYVSQVRVPAGQKNLHGGFLMLEDIPQHRVREKHEAKALSKANKSMDFIGYGPGFYAAGADPVRTSPLFKNGRWRKYTLHLDSVLTRDGETVYQIGFVAKRANHRTTGTYLQAGYRGQFEVQQRDYAVTHYEAKWQGDTVLQNAVARKYVGKPVPLARLYTNLYAQEQNEHAVDYVRAANGRYYVWHSRGLSLDAGRVLRTGQRFYRQRNCEQYFTLLPASTPPVAPNPKIDPRWQDAEIYQLSFVDYHPEFWQVYQRPTARK